MSRADSGRLQRSGSTEPLFPGAVGAPPASGDSIAVALASPLVLRVSEPIPALTIMLSQTKTALLMACSFTFSFMMLAVAAMAGRVEGEYDATTYLQATSLLTTMIQLLATIFQAPMFAMSIFASKARGVLISLQEVDARSEETQIKEQQQKIRNIYQAGFVWAVIVATIPMSILLSAGSIFKNIFSQSEEVSLLAEQYTVLYAFAMHPLLLRMAAEQIIFAFKRADFAMVAGLISFLGGGLLSLWLTFWGPNLGLQGVAIGFTIEAYVTCALFSLFLARYKDFEDISFFNVFGMIRNKKAIWRQAKELSKMGFPMMLQLGSGFASDAFLSVVAGWIGNNEQAAQNFVAQLSFFTIILIIASNNTTGHRVSEALGRKDAVNASRLARFGLLMTAILIAAICVFVSIFPQTLEKVVTDSANEDIVTISRAAIPISAVSVFFNGILYGLVQILRATDDKVTPTLISTFFSGAGMFFAFLAYRNFKSIAMINVAAMVANFFAVLVLFPRFKARTDVSRLVSVIHSEDSPASSSPVSRGVFPAIDPGNSSRSDFDTDSDSDSDPELARRRAARRVNYHRRIERLWGLGSLDNPSNPDESGVLSHLFKNNSRQQRQEARRIGRERRAMERDEVKNARGFVEGADEIPLHQGGSQAARGAGLLYSIVRSDGTLIDGYPAQPTASTPDENSTVGDQGESEDFWADSSESWGDRDSGSPSSSDRDAPSGRVSSLSA